MAPAFVTSYFVFEFEWSLVKNASFLEFDIYLDAEDAEPIASFPSVLMLTLSLFRSEIFFIQMSIGVIMMAELNPVIS